jgi:MYXO-CTERM domain-containing protein
VALYACGQCGHVQTVSWHEAIGYRRIGDPHGYAGQRGPVSPGGCAKCRASRESSGWITAMSAFGALLLVGGIVYRLGGLPRPFDPGLLLAAAAAFLVAFVLAWTAVASLMYLAISTMYR